MENNNLKVLNENPLKRMLRGEEVPKIAREHKKVAKIGNLYHEYVKQTSLQDYGIKGIHVAEILEEQDLVVVDRTTESYAWKTKPLTKQQFLDLVGRDSKIKAIAENQ